MAGADYLAMAADPEALLEVAHSVDGPEIARLLGEYQQMAKTMTEVGQFAHDVDNAAASQLFGTFVGEAHHESTVLSYAALNIADTCDRMKAKLSNFYEQYVERVRPAAQALQRAYDAEIGQGAISSPAALRTASTALAEALGHLYTDLAGNATIDVEPTFPDAVIPKIGADGRRAADSQTGSGGQVGPAPTAQQAGAQAPAVGAGQGGGSGSHAVAAALGSALGAVGGIGSSLGSAGAGLAGAAGAVVGVGADAAGLAASLGSLGVPAAADSVITGDPVADVLGDDNQAKPADLAGAAATRPMSDALQGGGGSERHPLNGPASPKAALAPDSRTTAVAASLPGESARAGSPGAMMGMPMMGGAGMHGANGEHRVASYLISKEQGERQFTSGLPLASEEILGDLDERERLAMQIASIDGPTAGETP